MGNEVDDWFAEYDNPMVDVVQAVRRLILDTDDRITECVEEPDVRLRREHRQLQPALEAARQPDVPHRRPDPR